MELDKRIKEGKRPLNCFDTNQAKQFIGKKGYFSDYLDTYTHLLNTEENVLQSIDEHHDDTYITSDCEWKFFLPVEWVKPEESEEPKEIYRAFTLDEFVNSYSLGDKIILRRKKGNRDIRHTLFTEYIEGDTDVCFNGIWYALDRLFNEYELYTGKGWKPFGIEVKE